MRAAVGTSSPVLLRWLQQFLRCLLRGNVATKDVARMLIAGSPACSADADAKSVWIDPPGQLRAQTAQVVPDGREEAWIVVRTPVMGMPAR